MLKKPYDTLNMVLSAHQIRSKRASATLQGELLRLQEGDIIKLPDMRTGRRTATDALPELSEGTIRILIHKINCMKYAARDILEHLTWTPDTLAALAESPRGSMFICDWYSHGGLRQYKQSVETKVEISDELALKAVVTYISWETAEPRFNNETIQLILAKFLNKIDIQGLSRNLVTVQYLLPVLVRSGHPQLIPTMTDAFNAAVTHERFDVVKAILETNLMKMLMQLPDIETGPTLTQEQEQHAQHLRIIHRTRAIKVQLELAQQILKRPDIIKGRAHLSYPSIITTLHEHYGVGFSIVAWPPTPEP